MRLGPTARPTKHTGARLGQSTKPWLRRAIGRIIHPKPRLVATDLRCPTLRLGGEYGGWFINPDALRAGSVVYSFGVGDDISFDLALIERFGCTVHGFDPTPVSIAYMRKNPPPPRFIMHEFGVGERDGTIAMFPPPRKGHVSHSSVARHGDAPPLALPVKRVRTIMNELGHDRVDLLKMDIEGAEYAVLDDLLTSGTLPRQLLIEFHHRFLPDGDRHTVGAIERLREAGYGLFAISDNNEEYSLLRD